MTAAPLRGRWFDGRRSQPTPVLVTLAAAATGPEVRIAAVDGSSRSCTVASRDVDWPEAWSTRRALAVLTVSLGDAGMVEIDDAPAWHDAFAAAGGRPALAQRMQTRWSTFLVVLVAAGLGLAAFYRWGTPWAATQVTRQVPLAWEQSLAERALGDLDRAWLKPSRLSAERQAALRRRFDALVHGVHPELQRYRGYTPAFALAFRSGMPPNAFALPGGTIVMTDAIVEEAERAGHADDALAGVLAHEIGHVVHRHTTRLVVEQAVLNVGLGIALGDVSSFVSIAGSALTGLAYRREHEAEADCFALALLHDERVPSEPMADLLLGLEKRLGGGGAGGRASSMATLLSSHPATEERATALKSGHAPSCR